MKVITIKTNELQARLIKDYAEKAIERLSRELENEVGRERRITRINELKDIIEQVEKQLG